MFITVKVSKKDWKNQIKDFKKAKAKSLDKILLSQFGCPRYKSAKKIMSHTGFKRPFSTIAYLKHIETNFFSKYYTVYIELDDSKAAKVFKTNIDLTKARIIFEVYYNIVHNIFFINAFALVDDNNPKAKTVIIETEEPYAKC